MKPVRSERVRVVSLLQCKVKSKNWLGGEVGGRLKREGVNVYIKMFHFVVQRKTNTPL